MENLSEKILNEYTNRIHELSLGKINHFSIRAAAVTDDNLFKDITALCILAMKGEAIKNDIKKIRNGNKGKIEKEKNQQKRASIKSERKALRENLYKEYPLLPIMNKSLNDLFFLKKFSLENKFSSWKDLRNEVSKKYHLLPYVSEKFLLTDSSFSINSVFYLKHLGIADQTSALEKNIQKIIKKRTLWEKREASFTSVIYALTHIVIAASKYYEKNTPQYKWVTDFFSENADEILSRSSLDVISEVALCFKITREEISEEISYKKFIQHLKENFPLNRKLTAKELNSVEHTNSILLLLFSSKKDFSQAPDLSTHPLFINRSL